MRGLNYLLAEVAAEICRRTQVYPAPDERTQLAFDTRQTDQTHRVAGLEVHQHVHVAIWPKVVPQHGTEQRQAADAVAPAERSDRLAIELEPRARGMVQHVCPRSDHS